MKGGLPCTDNTFYNIEGVGTDYSQCVLELCANRPSHEVVGSGSDYDTDSDDSDVD